MDAGEHTLLAGCADGSIYEASLVGPQQQLLLQGAARSAAAAAGGSSGSSEVVGGPGSCCFEGHTKAISSLVITQDGEQLLSGERGIPHLMVVQHETRNFTALCLLYSARLALDAAGRPALFLQGQASPIQCLCVPSSRCPGQHCMWCQAQLAI
jgi:hypothetical protein